MANPENKWKGIERLASDLTDIARDGKPKLTVERRLREALATLLDAAEDALYQRGDSPDDILREELTKWRK